MLIIDPGKRKNGAPRSRRRLAISLMLVILGLVVAFLTVSRDFGCVIPNHNSVGPSGFLYYRDKNTDTLYSLNLLTKAITEVRDQPVPLNGQTDAIISPNGLWRASWRINSAKKGYDLILEDNKTRKEIRNFGHFTPLAKLLFWSPDGQWLILEIPSNVSRDEGATALWMIHYENRVWRVITHNMDIGTTPRFSPTGATLAYISRGSLHLKNISADKQRTIVFSDEKWTNEFVWSPDGQWLAYTTMTSSQSTAIWGVRADGTQSYPLVDKGAINNVIDWRP